MKESPHASFICVYASEFDAHVDAKAELEVVDESRSVCRPVNFA